MGDASGESMAERMKDTSSAIRASAMAMLLWWSLAARLELGLGCLQESSGHSGGSR